MKAFTLAAVLVASTVTAQTINGVDAGSVNPCLLNCATNAATGAGCSGITDTTCYCNNQDFLAAATSCISTDCPDQLTAAVGFQSQICGASGSSGAASGAASATGDASGAASSDAAASATDAGAAGAASSDAAAASSAGAAASSGAAAASSGAAAASSGAAAASSGAAAASSHAAAASGSGAANSTTSGNSTAPSATPTGAAVANFIGFQSIALAAVGAVAGAVFVL